MSIFKTASNVVGSASLGCRLFEKQFVCGADSVGSNPTPTSLIHLEILKLIV